MSQKKQRDYYEVLGVSKTASADEIKSSYRKLCMKWHPDRNPDNKEEATEKFKEIGEAYQCLSDEKQKKIYDQFGHEGLKNGGGGFQQQNFDPNELFRSMFGQNFSFSSNGRGGPSSSQFFSTGGDDDDFGSFFQSSGRPKGGRGGFQNFFRGGQESSGSDDEYSNHQHGTKRKASEVTHSVNCTLEDLYVQKTKKIKFSKTIHNQNGTKSTQEKVLEFPLKAGIKQDSKIRFANEGDQFPGQIPADIVFKVNILPHETFQVEKQNLIVYKNIKLVQALKSNLNVKVKTLDDRELKIPITDIIHPKYEKVVSGEGLPHPKGGRGDLIIRFNVEYPTYLSNEQKEGIAKIL
jgi:DnaJ homolog subfamily B member 4